MLEGFGPLTIINKTHWQRFTCESRMGELAGGFHPGGISAPLPASAVGCWVVVTLFMSEDKNQDRRFFVSKKPSSQRPGFCKKCTGVLFLRVGRFISEELIQSQCRILTLASSFSAGCPFWLRLVNRFQPVEVRFHSFPRKWVARFPSDVARFLLTSRKM